MPASQSNKPVPNRLGPVGALQSAVLVGFAQMLGGDVFGGLQVGYGTRHFQDAVVSTGRKSQTAFASGTAIALVLYRVPRRVRRGLGGRRRPSDNSPRNMHWSSGLPKNWPMHPANPRAMGKSKPEPSFRTSAGARLMVTPWP
jgi:hypothetical protein